MTDLNKLTKTQLVDYIDKLNQRDDMSMKDLEVAHKDLNQLLGKLEDINDELNTERIKALAYKDLMDLLSETKSFESKNETQINSILLKRMRVLKYYNDK